MANDLPRFSTEMATSEDIGEAFSCLLEPYEAQPCHEGRTRKPQQESTPFGNSAIHQHEAHVFDYRRQGIELDKPLNILRQGGDWIENRR